MIDLESRLKRYPVETIVGLVRRANTQIWRSGIGESHLPTVLVKWRSVGHADLIPLTDPVSSDDTRIAARIVVERFHRVDSLIGLRRKIINELQRRAHE